MEQVLVTWGHSSVGEPSAKIIASALANCINTLSERNLIKLIVHFQFGDIAQLARAPALQAGGPGFESLCLHHMRGEPGESPGHSTKDILETGATSSAG